VNGEEPNTPQGDSQDAGMYVGGTAVTPMKRVPLLANFEEWMKMATDNVRQSDNWAKFLANEVAENQCEQFLELCADRLLP